MGRYGDDLTLFGVEAEARARERIRQQPPVARVDQKTQDKLSLIAEDPRVRGDFERFLAACKAAALSTAKEDGRRGLVLVNSVRRRLTDANGDLTISPRRLSAFWNKATTPKGKEPTLERPLVKTGGWDICAGSGSGNDGKPQFERRWEAEL